MPKYGNDMQDLIKYLGSHVKYPALSREIGADGMVVLSFIVGKDGILYNIKVARSAYNSENIEKTKARHITTKTKEPLTEIMIKNGFLALDNEAIRVLESMDKWTPGKQNGKEIDVRFTLPVKFKLE
jgi:protein TonB